MPQRVIQQEKMLANNQSKNIPVNITVSTQSSYEPRPCVKRGSESDHLVEKGSVH